MIAQGARRRPARRARRPRARSRRARRSSDAVVLDDAVIGRGSTVRGAIVGAGRAVGADCDDRRRRGRRRRASARRRATSSSAACACSRASRCPTARSRSERRVPTRDDTPAMSTTQPETSSTARRSPPPTRPTSSPTCSSIPEHLRDALWQAESAGVEPWDSPGGLIVAGMGGSAIGGRLARGVLGDQASRPVLSVARLRRCRRGRRRTRPCSASATRATPRRRSPASRPPACSAPARIVATTGGALAAGRARRGRAGDPDGRRAAAARRRRLHRPSPRSRRRRSAAPARSCTTEIDVAAAHLEQLAVAWGPEAGEESEAKVARAGAARHRPGDRRRRAHGADRLPLEDADQRERQAARVLAASCRSATTTRSSAGRRRAAPRPLQRRLPRRLRRHPARRAAHRA